MITLIIIIVAGLSLFFCYKRIFTTKQKELVKNISFITAPTLVIIFLILELFFRYVIPASELPHYYFSKKDLVTKFDSSSKEGVNTIGRWATQRARWRINNDGWDSDVDYTQKQDNRKLISVIGDSYIEGFYVDIDKSYPSLLRNTLHNDYLVYSFGISGAPLSHYLHLMRYANKYFNPDIFIINVVHNDFDESIAELNPFHKLFLTVSIKDNNITEILPDEKTYIQSYHRLEGRRGRILRKSAIYRYFAANLKIMTIGDLINRIKGIFVTHNEKYNANISVSSVEQNKILIEKAVNYILRKMKDENHGKRIIFIMDAPRNDIYNDKLSSSNVVYLNKILGKACAENKFEFIDLTDSMNKDYNQHGIKFNSDIDGHWDQYGHYFVYKQVLPLFKK